MPKGTHRLGRAATRDDVARHAGVSSAVVSYVLNDGPRPVAEATRQRVLQAVSELNYRPNAAARAFRLQRTNTLGLLVPDISNPFFAELAKAVQDRALERGYAVVFAGTENDPVREAQQIRFLAGRQVDGALIIGQTPGAELSPFTDAQVPFVSFDRFDGDRDIPTVVIDDYLAARVGVEHLRNHGHTRIAFIGGTPNLPAARARRRAWADVVADTGSDPEQLAVEGAFSRAGGYRAARELLSRPSRPTALFVATDTQSVGALRALNEAGLRVPDDLAMLSFDGTEEAEFSSPPLSVIRQPLDTMASTALDLLIDAGERAHGIHRVVPHQLILRASCGHHPDPSQERV